MDEKIQGRIDQVAQLLELDRQFVSLSPQPKICLTVEPLNSKALETQRYNALSTWSSHLTTIQNHMLTKSATAGGPDRSGGMGMGGGMLLGGGSGGGSWGMGGNSSADWA